MKIIPRRSPRGIALIIVMVAITAFSLAVAAFSYQMKVETRLARNASFDTEMVWLGRSGVETAKCLLGQARGPMEPYDSLNQKWAGGTGQTNSPFADIDITHIPLGNGWFKVTITDAERKFNINVADDMILQQAATLIGLDVAESAPVIASIKDWIDADDDTISGTESEYYKTQDPPYVAKNGPMDDLSELLLIRGISPEMYLGPKYTGPATPQEARKKRFGLRFSKEDQPLYAVGFADLFVASSGRFLNINTASKEELQLLPGVDDLIAQCIIDRRTGFDKVDGTEDDMPFRVPGELAALPCMNPQVSQLATRYLSTISTTFDVVIEVHLDVRVRYFHSTLRRLDQRNIVSMNFYWTETAPK